MELDAANEASSRKHLFKSVEHVPRFYCAFKMFNINITSYHAVIQNRIYIRYKDRKVLK